MDRCGFWCFILHSICIGVDLFHVFEGTTTYDNGDIKVTVTTSELSQEEEIHPVKKTEAVVPETVGANKKNNVPVGKKKPFKKVGKRKSGPKMQKKRDKRKGKEKRLEEALATLTLIQFFGVFGSTMCPCFRYI